MLVKDIMSTNVATVSTEDPVEVAARVNSPRRGDMPLGGGSRAPGSRGN